MTWFMMKRKNSAEVDPAARLADGIGRGEENAPMDLGSLSSLLVQLLQGETLLADMPLTTSHVCYTLAAPLRYA